MDTTIRGDATMRFTEYGAIMAGAMQEKHLNGSLLLAAMSDDLVGGGGVRLTTALDLWAGNFIAMEGKIGTAISDGILAEAYGKMFEREYGAATHNRWAWRSSTATFWLTTASRVLGLSTASTRAFASSIAGGGGGGGSEGGPPSLAPPPSIPPIGAVALRALKP